MPDTPEVENEVTVEDAQVVSVDPAPEPEKVVDPNAPVVVDPNVNYDPHAGAGGCYTFNDAGERVRV